MGKKKDQFIDKSKAITFKLSYRDNDDPFFKKPEGVSGSEVVERVFEVKSMPMDSSLTEEERQKRDKLLSLFSEEDQGKFKQEKKIEKEEPIGSKYWVPPEIRAKLAGKNLWIDQLAQKSQLKEQDVEDYEVEELEDVEEGDEQEEEVEENKQDNSNEDEGEEEEIATEKARKPNQSHEKKQRRGQSDDESSSNYSDDQSDEGYISNDGQDEEEEEGKAVKPKADDLTSADFPEFHYKDLVEKKIVEENIIPKYEKIIFNKDVRFKKFNEYGLPVGNGKFDYSKYFVQPSQQNVGVVEATLFADYKKAPRLAEDIDYEYSEMTEEQKEVFDALNADDDAGYEELEENFVNIATDGQKAIVEDEVEEEIKEIVTGKKKEKKNKGKKMHFTFDEEGKMTLQMNEEKKGTKKQAGLKQSSANNAAQKVVVLKKYESESSRVDNDAFDKVMKEFEDSDGENNDGYYDEEKYQGSSDEDYDVPELQNGILTGEGLNKILDDHLADMAGRAHSTLIPHNLMPNKIGTQEQQKEDQVPRPSWATRVNENGRRVNIEMEEKQKERMAQYEGFANADDIVKRVFVERIPIEKDNALASYLKREEDREANPDAYIENLERPVGENKLDETIATKNFSFSKVHENLSIIGDDINLSRSKKYSRLRAAEEEEEKRKADKEKEKVQEIEEKSSDEEEEEEEDEVDPLKVRSYELSHKIARGETKEEKQARKQALKEFKEARKQKKKMYKEGFEAVAKEQQSKIQNRTNFTNMQNIRGVSIKQIV